jgi:hypothetical protein
MAAELPLDQPCLPLPLDLGVEQTTVTLRIADMTWPSEVASTAVYGAEQAVAAEASDWSQDGLVAAIGRYLGAVAVRHALAIPLADDQTNGGTEQD